MDFCSLEERKSEMEESWAVGLQAAHYPSRALAYPLLVELQQLLRHLGSVESQAQAGVDVELRDDVLQGVTEGAGPAQSRAS